MFIASFFGLKYPEAAISAHAFSEICRRKSVQPLRCVGGVGRPKVAERLKLISVVIVNARKYHGIVTQSVLFTIRF